MGFDVNRFESVVSDEFLCAICTDVLDEPLVTPHCEHVFCGACIKYWLASGPTNAEPCCPIDRTPATVESLRAPLRSFRNLLLGQSIRCAFSPACSVYVKLMNLADHEAACNYNPVNIEKEVECENKCGARYKMQNKDKHNCVAYLQREMKAAEERFKQDSDRLRQLEKENGKLTKKLEEGRRKWEESRLVARNELQLNEEVNAYLKRQLEEAHEEIVRLKGQAAVAASKGLRSRAVSAVSNGGTSTLNSNGAAASANRPRSIATSPKDSSSSGNNHQTVTSNSLSVDTALLVDLGEFGNNSNNNSSSNGVSLSSSETSGSSARLSNSKFYSTSSSNISTGTVRSNGSGHSSSDSGGGHHSNRSSTESTTNVVKNIQEFFNRISLPKITSPSPQSLPPSSSTITSSASPSSTSTSASASASASSQLPVPPPKPPKPKPAMTAVTTNHHSNNHQNGNGNNSSSTTSNYANIDITSTYPSTSHSLTVLPLANGLTSGSATNSSNNSSSSLPPPLPPPSPTSLEQLIEDSCKKQRILQVLKMVNRRHFFPSNEYYKAAATKKGAHSFTLAYEIRLLEILESYITSESRVLDIGSGMGFIAVCLAHLAKTVIGLEHVKGLVTRATEVVNSHYGNLAQQGRHHNVVFFPEDGRYGLDRLGPYDLILVEPMVRQHVPDVILRQLKPGGCVVAVVKTDARLAMFRITVNRQKQTVYQTLIDDGAYLAAQHKDYLCDIRQQEMPFLNKFKSLQL